MQIVTFGRFAYYLMVSAVLGATVTQLAQGGPPPSNRTVSFLPSPTELSGFNFLKTKPAEYSAELWASRKSDGMALKMTVIAAPTLTEAQAICDRVTFPPRGRMPQSAPSGRKIGQQVWQSHYEGDRPTDGAFMLVTRDGTSIVVIRIAMPIGKNAKGFAVPRRFQTSHLTLAEDLAIGRLTKLKAMKLTSGGPVVQAAPTTARKPAKR